MYHLTRNVRTRCCARFHANYSFAVGCVHVKYDCHNDRQKINIPGNTCRTISNDVGGRTYFNSLDNQMNLRLNPPLCVKIMNFTSVRQRQFHSSSLLFVDDGKAKPIVRDLEVEDKSKVEEYVEHQKVKVEEKNLKKLETARRKLQEAYIFKPDPAIEQPTAPLPVVRKKPLTTRIWNEILHYYKGFKLLFLDTRIAARLLWAQMNGKTLTRRENKQFRRTVADLFRLVPFSVFLIVPFMEFLLPVAIKLFPGMLPSTFADAKTRADKRRVSLNMRLNMAEFLQDTIEEISVSSDQKGKKPNEKLKQFAKFVNKTRSEGVPPTNEEIMKYSQLFEDEITLDIIPYDQLKALCRIMMVSPIGTGNFLRFKMRLKLQELKGDDQMIRIEGIDSLTSEELQLACSARGMRALGVSVESLKSNLRQWLELSLDKKIPASLLLLSRTIYMKSEHVDEQLKLTISQFPERLIDEMELKIGAVEGEEVDRQTLIDIIKHEEEQIKTEKLEKDKEICDEERRKQQETLEPIMTIKEDQLSMEELLKVQDTVSMSSKEKLDEIKGERKEYKEDLEELSHVVSKPAVESKASTRLGKRVDAILQKVNKSLIKLENSATEQQKIDEDDDGFVTTTELSEAIKKLQNAPDETKTQRLLEIMDTDKDGSICLNEMRIAVKLLANEDLADLNQEQIKEVLQLVQKSERIVLLEQVVNKKKTNYLNILVPSVYSRVRVEEEEELK